MSGIARECPPFTMGIDCLSLPDEATAAKFYADGYRFCGLYLEVLTTAARDAVFNAGMGITPITEARSGPLNGSRGQQVGADSMRRAMNLGIPPTVHVTIDNESTDGTPLDVMSYINEFAAVLGRGGYGQMHYVGAPQTLTAAQLYSLRGWPYWHSCSRVPEPECGYSLIQLTPGNILLHSHQIDISVTQRDYRGRLPVMWWPS